MQKVLQLANEGKGGRMKPRLRKEGDLFPGPFVHGGHGFGTQKPYRSPGHHIRSPVRIIINARQSYQGGQAIGYRRHPAMVAVHARRYGSCCKRIGGMLRGKGVMKARSMPPVKNMGWIA